MSWRTVLRVAPGVVAAAVLAGWLAWNAGNDLSHAHDARATQPILESAFIILLVLTSDQIIDALRRLSFRRTIARKGKPGTIAAALGTILLIVVAAAALSPANQLLPATVPAGTFFALRALFWSAIALQQLARYTRGDTAPIPFDAFRAFAVGLVVAQNAVSVAGAAYARDPAMLRETIALSVVAIAAAILVDRRRSTPPPTATAIA